MVSRGFLKTHGSLAIRRYSPMCQSPCEKSGRTAPDSRGSLSRSERSSRSATSEHEIRPASLIGNCGFNEFGIDAPNVLGFQIRQPDGAQADADGVSSAADELLDYAI